MSNDTFQVQRDSSGKPFIKMDIQIPGRPAFIEGDILDKFHEKPTHVQLHTSRHLLAPGVITRAIEIAKDKEGGEYFSSSSYVSTIIYDHQITRVTEKVIRQIHQMALSRLKTLRPDLFP